MRPARQHRGAHQLTHPRHIEHTPVPFTLPGGVLPLPVCEQDQREGCQCPPKRAVVDGLAEPENDPRAPRQFCAKRPEHILKHGYDVQKNQHQYPQRNDDHHTRVSQRRAQP